MPDAKTGNNETADEGANEDPWKKVKKKRKKKKEVKTVSREAKTKSGVKEKSFKDLTKADFTKCSK